MKPRSSAQALTAATSHAPPWATSPLRLATFRTILTNLLELFQLKIRRWGVACLPRLAPTEGAPRPSDGSSQAGGPCRRRTPRRKRRPARRQFTPSSSGVSRRLCVGRPRLFGAAGERAVEPVGHHLGDGVAVLFQHHHVAIAVDADIGEADEGALDAGLGEVAYGAVV